MKYKLIAKVNPLKREDPKKWYASPVNPGRLTVKDFARTIASRSSALPRSDIEDVLDSFLEELSVVLTTGMSVKLGEFGTMRLILQSGAADTHDEFDSSKIKGVKVAFTPGTELKNHINNIVFEEEK
ncbi:MAG: HU family DNA-binding protein [Prevotellaceae bacterium]|jgi:predicted histone-like DNA-binding protein|nr:HU family DNA-binding protein [Prevotellaceae bacterium]